MPMSGRWNRKFNRRGLANRETGFVDLNPATYQFDTTGSIQLVATIAQGASVNQRVGKKVVLKSIQVRGGIGSRTTTTVSDTAWLLVYDKRPTAALPAITDILATNSPNAFLNDANSGRFTILRRWTRTFMGNITTPSTGREFADVEEFIKVNKPCVFKAAGTGAMGDIEQGAVYFVTLGDIAAGTAAVQGSLGFRTRFIDV